MFLLFFPVAGFASQFFFDSKTQNFQVGQDFLVDIFINTQGEAVGAVEGIVVFPKDTFDIQDINNGNSVVSFWVQKPVVRENSIDFSGVIPGGFIGSRGLLFSTIISPKKVGDFKLDFSDFKALLNDGVGSESVAGKVSFQVSVASSIYEKTFSIFEIKDTTAPESFVPEIAKEETLFGGKWFLVFSTQDKLSGIDYYEVKESKQNIVSLVLSRFVKTESPHILQDQKLQSFIFVKAVDKQGNKKIVTMRPQYFFAWHQSYENWMVIMALVFVILFSMYYLWKKRNHLT